MARKPTSAIESSPAVRELVDNLLAANTPYAQIVDEVQLATGVTLSLPALSRYRQKWSAAKIREDLAGKEIHAMLTVLQARPDTDLRQGAKALIERKLIQALAKDEEGFDRADTIELATLLLKMDRLEQMGETVRLQKERLDLLKQRVAAAAEKVDELGKAKNLDPETLKKIREEIYGLAPVA